jgi:hypothetical protein
MQIRLRCVAQRPTSTVAREQIPADATTIGLSAYPLYFITCCAYRRRPVLANPQLHDAFTGFAARAQMEFGILVGRYVGWAV